MIKIFGIEDKEYNTNGDIVIAPTRARVKNSDNGDFYLELTCGAEYSDFIMPNRIIVAPTPSGDQPFRIRSVTKKSNKLEVKAWHVYYDGENYLIADSYAQDMTCAEAMAHFNAATDTESPFTVASDIEDPNTFRCVRKSLTECLKTVLERWGGHLVRDKWSISILESIEHDNGITIQYRKNLKELTATYDFSSVVTKLMPVGKDGILLNDYVYSSIQYPIPFTKTVSFDQDIDPEDYPDEESYKAALRADLYNQAVDYVEKNCTPLVNYDLKGNPEKVSDIGDVIKVIDERIGVEVLTEVISYEYDAITGTYASLQFGNFKPSLDNLVGGILSTASSQLSQASGSIADSLYSLQRSKQDKMSAGDGITITSSTVSISKINSYTFEDNVYCDISGRTATFYMNFPRPINGTIRSFELKIGSATITDEFATIETENINDCTLKATVSATPLVGVASQNGNMKAVFV